MNIVTNKTFINLNFAYLNNISEQTESGPTPMRKIFTSNPASFKSF